jgi:hypothetical protein
MSLSDTLITNGNPASVIYKDILRPGSTQSLGGSFTQGTYRAVNITDPTASPCVKMFYVEVFNATTPSAGTSNTLPIQGSLIFTKAYVVLRDLSPSARLRVFLFWTGNYTNLIVSASGYVTNQSASFLIIGI